MGGRQKTLPLNLAEFKKHLVYLYTQGNVWYDICSQWSQDSLGVHALLKFILGWNPRWSSI